MKLFIVLLFVFSLLFCQQNEAQNKQVVVNTVPEEKIDLNTSKHNIYSWKENYTIENKLVNRISVPKGYKRSEVPENSYADWLRNLPLKSGSPEVMLYNGNKKGNQGAHHAVIDIDIGTRDLQQCADAVIRLRAEYLFSSGEKEKIAFNFTSGDKCSYSSWKTGVRPIISGNNVIFKKTQNADSSYKNFKNYLQIIFSYCGTHSLSKELNPVKEINDLKAGDVFIMGGFPGHAVIVLDIALKEETNEKLFLLAQSYMPAQDIQILKNPSSIEFGPWYSINFGETLRTPEWTFYKDQLKRF